MSFHQGEEADPETKCRPTFNRITPENRRFVVFLTNGDPTAATDSKKIIHQLSKLILGYAFPQKLRFNQSVPIAEFGGNVMISCDDEDTAKWLICSSQELQPPHSAWTFIDYFGLIPCSIVLPVIEPKEATSLIFKIFEAQNQGLMTDKWVVVGRTDLGPCGGSEEVARNEKMDIYIDTESQKIIKSQGSKLNYMSYTITFKF